jgi:hypothetical protein
MKYWNKFCNLFKRTTITNIIIFNSRPQPAIVVTENTKLHINGNIINIDYKEIENLTIDKQGNVNFKNK